MSIVIGVIMVVCVAAATVLPLLGGGESEPPERPDERSERLEREKTVALLAIREADFDRATGKLTDDDYTVLRGAYEQRALGALSQLERKSTPAASRVTAASGTPAAYCARCGAAFGGKDRFCASCGNRRGLLDSASAP